MIYLDYAAATPLDPRVFDAMKPWLVEHYGNPSSIHILGQKARAAVDKARIQVSSFLNCQPTEVFFTATGTESCNWAISGIMERSALELPHLIVSSIEHSAVLETARHLEQEGKASVTYLPVDDHGLVSIDDLSHSLTERTRLVSIMMVNNEIGTLQPIVELARICRDRDILFHTDACQAAGYYDLNVEKLGVDLLTLNASKIYGPKGVGVLYVKDGVMINPLVYGGGQEFGLRAGTENVPGIIGLGRALELIVHQQEKSQQIAEHRDLLWKNIYDKISNTQLNGSITNRVPNNLNIFIPGIDAETIVKLLDQKGFALSTGSACASGKTAPSHVIMALGFGVQRARSSLRISLGYQTSLHELTSFAVTLARTIKSSLVP